MNKVLLIVLGVSFCAHAAQLPEKKETVEEKKESFKPQELKKEDHKTKEDSGVSPEKELSEADRNLLKPITYVTMNGKRVHLE